MLESRRSDLPADTSFRHQQELPRPLHRLPAPGQAGQFPRTASRSGVVQRQVCHHYRLPLAEKRLRFPHLALICSVVWLFLGILLYLPAPIVTQRLDQFLGGSSGCS